MSTFIIVSTKTCTFGTGVPHDIAFFSTLPSVVPFCFVEKHNVDALLSHYYKFNEKTDISLLKSRFYTKEKIEKERAFEK